MNGLTSLAYRGYDSAGVAIWEGSELTLRKAKGKIENLKNLLEESPVSGKSGIGHTRWATHGEPSDINAHPHTDTHKTLAIVHNGIIENYQQIKSMLIKNGCVFVSQTDTEVVAQLFGYYYNGNPLETLKKTIPMLEGSFALAIVTEASPERTSLVASCVCRVLMVTVPAIATPVPSATPILTVSASSASRILTI